jgi:raffinose/stachyose/melibiose transport system substrate-binding protein
MRTKNRSLVITLASVLLCLLLPVAVMASGRSEAPAEDGQTVITMMSFHVPGGEQAADVTFYERLEQFRAEHPDWVIEHEFVPHDNYDDVMTTRIAARDLPDVYPAKSDSYQILDENGLIGPITEFVQGDADFFSNYTDGAMDDFLWNDQIWGMPWNANPNHIVYYNSEILAEAGWDEFPTTMDDFLEALADIRDAGYIPLVMGNRGRWLAPSLIFNTMVYRYTDADYFTSVFNDTGATFLDPPFIDAAELLLDMVELGAFNEDMNSIDNLQQREVYYSGEAAMFVEGGWALAPLIETAPADIRSATRLAVFPAIEGNEEYANIVAGGGGWGATVNGQVSDDRMDDVMYFLKWMYGPEYAAELVTRQGNPAMTVDTSALDLPRLQAEYLNLPIQFAPIFDVRLPASIVDVYFNDMQDLLIGRITAQQYAERVEAARVEALGN